MVRDDPARLAAEPGRTAQDTLFSASGLRGLTPPAGGSTSAGQQGLGIETSSAAQTSPRANMPMNSTRPVGMMSTGSRDTGLPTDGRNAMWLDGSAANPVIVSPQARPVS